MKNKLGIITFHSAENYGAFLQVYAMQNVLNKYKNKFDIEVVDYRPDYITDDYKINFKIFCENTLIKNLKSLVINSIMLPNKIIKKYKFHQCLKLLKLSKKMYKTEDDFKFSEDYDVIILGSDQIWNPAITMGIDKIYFGQGFKNVKKIIGYAVSLGIIDYSEKDIDLMKKYIPCIDDIGLRESNSIGILENICSRKYEYVMDPTLLVDNNLWKSFYKNIRFDKYVLVYQLEQNDKIMEDAYRIAKENNLKIVSFGEPGLRNFYKDKKINSISCAGPKEFLGAIKNAEIVLTNSYHGTCFSIIFNTVFFTYAHSKTSSRMVDLSKILGFEERIIDYGKSIFDNLNFIEINDKGFFKNINEKRDIYRRKSIDFIEKNLNYM